MAGEQSAPDCSLCIQTQLCRLIRKDDMPKAQSSPYFLLPTAQWMQALPFVGDLCDSSTTPPLLPEHARTSHKLTPLYMPFLYGLGFNSCNCQTYGSLAFVFHVVNCFSYWEGFASPLWPLYTDAKGQHKALKPAGEISPGSGIAYG